MKIQGACHCGDISYEARIEGVRWMGSSSVM